MKWTVIDGDVYDITNYIAMHPGGKKKINLGVGKESTKMFYRSHKGIRLELTPLPDLKFGELFTKNKSATWEKKTSVKEKKPEPPADNGFLSIPNLKIGIL